MKRFVSLLLALVFVVCTGRVLYQLYQYRQGDRLNAQAEELVKPAPPWRRRPSRTCRRNRKRPRTRPTSSPCWTWT